MSEERLTMPVVDVRGVVDASGAAGGSVGDKAWDLIYHFAAWRVGGGPVQTRPRLRLLQPIAKAELSRLRAEVRPCAVWHVRATIAAEASAHGWLLARVVERVGVEPADAELTAIAEQLQQPVVVDDPQFGPLTLDRRSNQFRGEVEWNGRRVGLTIPATSDAQAIAADMLAVARALWTNSAAWQRRVQAFAAARLLPLKNGTWLGDDEAEVSTEEFVSRMRLKSISIDDADDGRFTFWHDDGDLFWGHAIQITGTLANGPTEADIPG